MNAKTSVYRQKTEVTRSDEAVSANTQALLLDGQEGLYLIRIHIFT